MTKALLTIGEFARRTGLTERALRLYGDRGLLEPREIDPQTGYRRYGEDQIDDGVHGLLLPDPADIDGFSQRLRHVLEDESLGQSLGDAARDRVLEQFLGLRSLDQYSDLVQRLLSTER